MDQSTPITNHFVAIVRLKDVNLSREYIETKAEELVQALGLNVVDKIAHEFPVQGITLAFILSQSHLVIHTWPELKMVHMDLATCDTTTKWKMADLNEVLAKVFGEDGQAEINTQQIFYRL